MDINSLDEKLKKIQENLKLETDKLKDTAKNLSEQTFDDPRDEHSAKEHYYSYLDSVEQNYQKKNNEYKDLISQFSDAYLEICDFYVGPELPRSEEETFFDSKHDINTLYFFFVMSLFLKG